MWQTDAPPTKNTSHSSRTISILLPQRQLSSCSACFVLACPLTSNSKTGRTSQHPYTTTRTLKCTGFGSHSKFKGLAKIWQPCRVKICKPKLNKKKTNRSKFKRDVTNHRPDRHRNPSNFWSSKTMVPPRVTTFHHPNHRKHERLPKKQHILLTKLNLHILSFRTPIFGKLVRHDPGTRKLIADATLHLRLRVSPILASSCWSCFAMEQAEENGKPNLSSFIRSLNRNPVRPPCKKTVQQAKTRTKSRA